MEKVSIQSAQTSIVKEVIIHQGQQQVALAVVVLFGER